MRYKKLSIIVPVYNEVASMEKLLGRVGAQIKRLSNWKVEVIVVDDGSSDGTKNILRRYRRKYRLVFHPRNYGLMQAMITGLIHSQGELILVQHSDLEYQPKDWPKLINPLVRGEVDMVLGSRYMKTGMKKLHFDLGYQWGSQVLTQLFNLLYGTRLTDIFTAHRAFNRKVLINFKPISRRFAFETEITAQTVKAGLRLKEVPISYKPRSFLQGKKLRWYDALEIVIAMLRNRFTGI